MPGTGYNTEYPNECPLKELRKLQAFLNGAGDKWDALRAAWFVEGYFLGRYMQEQTPLAGAGDEGPLPLMHAIRASCSKIDRPSIIKFLQHAIDTADENFTDVGSGFSRGNDGQNLLCMVAVAERIKAMLLGATPAIPDDAD